MIKIKQDNNFEKFIFLFLSLLRNIILHMHIEFIYVVIDYLQLYFCLILNLYFPLAPK